MAQENTNGNSDEVLRGLINSKRHRLSRFRDIDVNNQGFVMLRLSTKVRKDIVGHLDNHEIINLLSYLDPDKASALLRQMPPRRAKRITDQLADNNREKVEFLLKFHPKTAASMMSLDYVLVDKNSYFKDVSSNIIEHEQNTGKFPSILVMEDGFLIGELPGHALATHSSREKIIDYIKRVPAIRYDSDERKVVDSFVKHPHNKVVVLDEDDSILGIIHSDDILAIMDRHSMRQLYGFAGVNKEEDALDSVWTKVRYRYSWLIINLGTAFLAASVVGLFEPTIQKFTLLAVYMPIVAGMGGNAATQTLAVAVRGLVLKEIELGRGTQFVAKEVGAGMINGVINGVIVATVAVIFNKNPMLGLVLALAMMANLFIAGFFGALIPMVMKALGKDPATSATIFITTCTDVGGFFVFLGLATIMLK